MTLDPQPAVPALVRARHRASPRRRRWIGATVTAAALTLSACSSSSSSSVSSTAGSSTPGTGGTSSSGSAAPAGSGNLSARANTEISAINTPPASFDPIQADNSTVDMVSLPMYDTLVKFDDAGKIINSLATAATTSADGKTISVTMRANATFHDGSAVTATDVKYTLDRIKKINIGVASLLTAYASSAVVDPTHLTITLAAPYAPFVSALTRVYILNSKLVTAHEGKDSGQSWLSTNDAGSGPYELTSSTPNQAINFAQYPKYWGGFTGQPKNATIQIMNASTQRSALLNQSIDVAMNIDTNDWSSFSANSQFTLDKANTYEMLYVFFKMKDSAVSNKYLREAIADAYDYTQHEQDILKGAGQLAKGVLPSVMACYDATMDQPTYDPTKAKALLAQSGLKNVSVSLSYLSTEAEMVKAATLLQSNLKDIGITLNLKAITYPEYVVETKSNATTPDLGMIYAFPPFSDPSSIMYQVFDSKFINTGQNWGGYSNPQVDTLVEKAQTITDSKQSCSLYNEAEKLIIADTPTVNMSNPQFVTVYNKRISGYKYEPSHNYVVDFYRTKVS